jgi:hypothetical protein
MLTAYFVGRIESAPVHLRGPPYRSEACPVQDLLSEAPQSPLPGPCYPSVYDRCMVMLWLRDSGARCGGGADGEDLMQTGLRSPSSVIGLIRPPSRLLNTGIAVVTGPVSRCHRVAARRPWRPYPESASWLSSAPVRVLCTRSRRNLAARRGGRMPVAPG